MDDNATNLSILERQLTAWELACDTAADPSAAPALLRAAANAGQALNECGRGNPRVVDAWLATG